VFFAISFSQNISGQQVIRNLDFEDLDVVGRLVSWEIRNPNNSFQIQIDTTQSYSGNVSILLESNILDSKRRGAANAFSIIKSPNLNQRSSIKVTGYMKTEDLEDGTAFIGLQMNGAKGIVSEVNTAQKNIKGNTPWTEYSIEGIITSDVESVSFGAQITGRGKVWFDDFHVVIDGVSLDRNINLKEL